MLGEKVLLFYIDHRTKEVDVVDKKGKVTGTTKKDIPGPLMVVEYDTNQSTPNWSRPREVNVYDSSTDKYTPFTIANAKYSHISAGVHGSTVVVSIAQAKSTVVRLITVADI